jgi:hypothetical protein
VVGAIYIVYRMLRSRCVVGNEPQRNQDWPREQELDSSRLLSLLERDPDSTSTNEIILFQVEDEYVFQKADHLYAHLRRLYEMDLISRGEFDELLGRFRMLDNEGWIWAKDTVTGEWLYKNRVSLPVLANRGDHQRLA